jgi:hypothetical protein
VVNPWISTSDDFTFSSSRLVRLPTGKDIYWNNDKQKMLL